jgi:hypothetical protein
MPESFREAVTQVKDFVDPELRYDPGIVRRDPSAREWKR